eukprot:sb/3467820/
MNNYYSALKIPQVIEMVSDKNTDFVFQRYIVTGRVKVCLAKIGTVGLTWGKCSRADILVWEIEQVGNAPVNSTLVRLRVKYTDLCLAHGTYITSVTESGVFISNCSRNATTDTTQQFATELKENLEFGIHLSIVTPDGRLLYASVKNSSYEAFFNKQLNGFFVPRFLMPCDNTTLGEKYGEVRTGPTGQVQSGVMATQVCPNGVETPVTCSNRTFIGLINCNKEEMEIEEGLKVVQKLVQLLDGPFTGSSQLKLQKVTTGAIELDSSTQRLMSGEHMHFYIL